MSTPILARVPGSDSFPKWAVSTLGRLQKIAGAGALVAAVSGILGVLGAEFFKTWDVAQLRNMLMNESTRAPRANLALIQGVISFGLAALLPRPKLRTLVPEGQVSKETQSAVKRIHDTLRVTFMLWSAYYVASWLCILNGRVNDSGEDVLTPFGGVVTLSLNACTGLTLFWLFLELSEITVESADGTRREESFQTARVHKFLSAGLLGIILLVAWLGLALDSSGSGPPALMGLCVAYLSGLSLCLVTGRLGSKLIDPGPVTLSALYFYALLQPLGGVFPDHPEIQLLATTIALVLKLLLWLVFVWAFSTGVIGEYVTEIREFLLSPGEKAVD